MEKELLNSLATSKKPISHHNNTHVDFCRLSQTSWLSNFIDANINKV